MSESLRTPEETRAAATPHSRNIDQKVVRGFGDEWSRFDQSAISAADADAIFSSYFAVFPWEHLSADAVGFDLGCGSGRWARMVARRVGILHCIDASPEAIEVARRNLLDLTNCRIHLASVDRIPLADGSCDFGYSLGVLHHLPDPVSGLRSCVAKLKSGAPFLLYLYYAFDNRPWWFRALWRVSDLFRRVISRLPYPMRFAASQLVALVVYWPLARTARLLDRAGVAVERFPLSFYRQRSFYVMRTDALDRLGTRLEHRFTRSQIRHIMENAGLRDVRFHEGPPYWCGVGLKS